MHINRSNKITYILFIGIFLLLFLCNSLSMYVADDFQYMYSFATNERITHFSQIFPSMVVHTQQMNGRFISHFLAQLFLMLPKFIFNVTNSFFFTMLVFIIYKLAKIKQENNFLLIGIFASVWLFVPEFGQVVLWLDGACNYLWSVFFNLLYIIPFVLLFNGGVRQKNKILKVFYFIFSFIVGSLSENTSSAFIFMAVLLLIAAKYIKRRKISPYYVLCVIAACIGYLFLIFAPSMSDKSTTFSLYNLRKNFVSSIYMLQLNRSLLVSFVVFLVLSYTHKIDRDRIVLSIIFFCGALFANFIMITALYYPERRLICTVLLLIVSDSILASALFEVKGWKKDLVSCFISILLLNLSINLPMAINDMYSARGDMRKNEAQIISCRNSGQLDVEVPIVFSQTKYTVLCGAKYLDTEDPTSWPNDTMAAYYGVNSIIGFE